MKSRKEDHCISSTPKPLLEINGVPIIRRLIEKLNFDNIRVAIVINPEDEKKFSKKLNGLKFEYYFQNSPKGTADALYSARQFVTDDIFGVFMGDDIFEYDELNLKNIEEPTIFAYHHYNCRNFGTLKLDSKGYVEKILEKEKVGKGLINTGIYIMPKQFFQIFDRIKINTNSNEYYLTEAVPILYEIGFKMFTKSIRTWKGINFPIDLDDANAIYNGKPMIRLARTGDIESLIIILNQLKSNSMDHQYDFANGIITLQKIIDDENYYFMVAEINKQIVGTATMLIQRNLTHNGRSYAHIENVVTDSGFRKRGIGKILLLELVNVAKSLDCYKVILNCSLENSKFYNSVGFSLTNEIEMRLDF